MLTQGASKRTTKVRPQDPPARVPDTAWWIISRCENGRTEVLTISGEEALPVFSFREEAELFLWSVGLGDGWRSRESRCGELLSVLCGPCSGIRRVALDPLPQPWTGPTFGLLCLSCGDFVRILLDG